ncbi:MAG: homoserine kinase [Chloroflexi bacterium]|nr:homoserine kinase [Chloroflexota bacterium]
MTELRVRAPATSANLGPGFDSFALALPLLAEFEVRPARTWSVEYEGDGDGLPPDANDDLFVVAARAVARTAKEHLAPQHVFQRTAIPLGRGLGSSAAAIAAGVTAGNALLGEPLDRRTLLRIAAEVEGHPDNVAAALYGGMTVALPTAEGPAVFRSAFPRAWRICLLVPKKKLATREARAALPASVPRADAVFNLAHASALVAAILRADGALLSIAMHDRLHEPARARLVPGLDDVVSAARSAGAFGAALSGAGPAVIAVAPARLAARVVAAMEEAADDAGAPGRARVLRVRAAGAQVRVSP